MMSIIHINAIHSLFELFFRNDFPDVLENEFSSFNRLLGFHAPTLQKNKTKNFVFQKIETTKKQKNHKNFKTQTKKITFRDKNFLKKV